MTIGIYAIVNTVDKKVYIGKSKNIEYRWYLHKSQLRNFSHINKGLRDDWLKYGEACFSFVILEESTLEVIDQLEVEYIKKYRKNNLYNYDSKNHPWNKVGYFNNTGLGRSSAIEKIVDCDGDILPLRYCPNCNLHKLATSFIDSLYCLECSSMLEEELQEEIDTIQNISLLTGNSSAPEVKPVIKYKLKLN